MNKQLLRLKQRSNNDILQVAESDDNNNLYVNVDDGKLDVGTIDEVTNVTDVDSVNLVDTVTTVSSVTDVVNVQDVDSVNLVDEVTNITSVDTVDKVSKSLTYGYSTEYGEQPWLVSDKGYGYTVEGQEGLLLAEGYVTFPANAAADTVKYVDIPVHPDDNHRTWLLSILNPTSSNLTVKFNNKWTLSTGQIAYSEVTSHTLTATTQTVFSSTAWSSCFTSINSVLTDESGDLNDTLPPGSDVPFTFGAVNDAIYFGAEAQFRTLLLNVGTAGVYNADGFWEYWNGSSWSKLDVQTVYPPGTDITPFKTTGPYIITFDMVDDWVPYDIPGSPTSQYWIRWRVTNFTSMTTGPALTSGSYTKYTEVFGRILEFEYAFNNLDDGRLVISNNTALTLPANIYYQLRSV